MLACPCLEFRVKEAEYNAFKLSYLNGDEEGKLIWPAPPYSWSEDGEHDTEYLLMPLSMMEDIRSSCGVEDEAGFLLDTFFDLCF